MRGYNVLFNALLPAIQNNDKPVPPCANRLLRWGQFQSLLRKMQHFSAFLKAALKNNSFFFFFCLQQRYAVISFHTFSGWWKLTAGVSLYCFVCRSVSEYVKPSVDNEEQLPKKSLSVRVCALFHSAVSQLEIERWKRFCFFSPVRCVCVCVCVCFCSCPNSFFSSIPPQGSFHKEITWQCVSVCPEPFC